MPGSGKQPPEIQGQIKELLEAGFDPTTIHRRLKVGRSSIYRMKRCLQQHGTNYMPPELNKKNGRPKVLTPDQELEVREWLRDPKNRTRYLDDLVWLIHDRFGIVCSTTTMSKMKRKWLRVIDYDETGTPLDDLSRALLLETHPDLPILRDPAAQPCMLQPDQQPDDAQQNDPGAPVQPVAQPVPGSEMMHSSLQAASMAQAIAGATAMQHNAALQAQLDPQIDSQLEQQIDSRLDPHIDSRLDPHIDSQLEQQIGSQLERQLQSDMNASSDFPDQHVSV